MMISKRIALAGLALLAGIAAARAEDRYTLLLDSKAIAIIGSALGARPYAEVAPLVNDLAAQIRLQEQAREKARVEADIAARKSQPDNK